MRNKMLLIGLMTAGAAIFGSADANEDKDQAAVAKLLPTAKVTLSSGLAASESKGQPISARSAPNQAIVMIQLVDIGRAGGIIPL